MTYVAIPEIRPPPPIATNIGVEPAGVLPEDLHPDRALAGDHIGIVERVDEGQAALDHQLGGALVALAVRLAGEHDLGTARHAPRRP